MQGKGATVDVGLRRMANLCRKTMFSCNVDEPFNCQITHIWALHNGLASQCLAPAWYCSAAPTAASGC